MKRRAALASSQQRPAKRQKSQLAITQEIVKKELRKNTDWKYTDFALNGTAIYNTGQISSLLTNLTRGDNGYQNFQGNIIRPQGLLVKYHLDTTQVFEHCRVMLIQWFDANVSVLSGVLQTTTTGLATVSPTLVTNKGFIKVLYDKTHSLAPTAADAGNVYGAGVPEPVTVYIPGRKLKPVRYASTSNTVQDGDLLLVCVSNDTALTTVNLTFYSRVTFADQ